MNRRDTIVSIAIFLAVSATPAWADEQKDHICFRAFDADKDGMVTFEEFEKHHGRDEARFKAADVDKDGKLTHDEYHGLLGHGS
jgi:Ca2+-binding EF-hand superfamily protein